MKTRLEQICDEVAKEELELYIVDHFSELPDTSKLRLWPEASRRYGIEVGKATLAKASENADVMVHPRDEFKPIEMQRYVVDEDSILDENNIVLP